MAELVDALVSEASEETHGSSSLLGHTSFMNYRDFQIESTTVNDLDQVMKIYDQARLFMRENNNHEQWINGYPSREIILEDMAKGHSYVIKKNNAILAVFTFINDKDETYDYIEGSWLNNERYGVIHRIASARLEKGMLNVAVNFAFNFANNVRIDTHEDNIVMQKTLEKEGFSKCGVIYLKDGNPRFAYHKKAKENLLVDTTMIYLKRDDCYLLLYRNKKKNDINKGKWIGIGGHVEQGETIDQCAIRETKEETGFDVRSLSVCGEVLFIDDDLRIMMYVYEIEDFDGELTECDEGELRWIPIKNIYDYPMWEGDKAFVPKVINHEPYFKMVLTYHHSELVSIDNY